MIAWTQNRQPNAMNAAMVTTRTFLKHGPTYAAEYHLYKFNYTPARFVSDSDDVKEMKICFGASIGAADMHKR